MVSYESSAELESYILSVTLDFLDYDIYGYCKKMELKRQETTRAAIISVLKLYKNIKLTEKEQELMENYPLKNDVHKELESCIAYVAFNIGQDIRKKVNDMRYNLKYMSYSVRELTDKNGVTIDLCQTADDYYKYVEVLDEYTKSLVHAYVYKHEIQIITPQRVNIHPIMNYDNECFIKQDVPVKVMK